MDFVHGLLTPEATYTRSWNFHGYSLLIASKPGSPEGAGREGKESLVHTDCACVKLYQDFWYIVYFPYISSVNYSQRGCSQSVYGGRSRHG